MHGALSSKRPGRTRSRTASDKLFSLALLTPAALLTTLFILAPVVDSVCKSFQKFQMKNIIRGIPGEWNNFANYLKLFQSGRLAEAAAHTFAFVAAVVIAQFLLGMMLALIMDKAMRGIGLVRTTALIPWAIPTAVSALIWCYLYDGTSGIVAMVFSRLGIIASPELLLTTPGGTMFGAVLADVWKTTPYMALLLLAGLQVIDRGLYESSAIDGAGAVRTFTSITLPLLKPSMLVALLFRTLDAFRVYDLIAVLTKGTPETLSIYAYKMMIGQSNYGYGSVIVVAMFALVALIAFVYVKVLGAELIRD